jgi:hypothetical protein
MKLRELGRLAVIVYGLSFASVGRGDVMDQCFPLSLNQSFDELKARIESFLPGKTMALSSNTCVREVRLLFANYSQMCLVGSKNYAAIATATSSPVAGRLSSLILSVPYSADAGSEIEKLVSGEPIKQTGTESEFIRSLLANAQESKLFSIDGGSSLLLLTKEKGIMALSDRDFWVIRMYPTNEDGALMKALRSCIPE